MLIPMKYHQISSSWLLLSTFIVGIQLTFCFHGSESIRPISVTTGRRPAVTTTVAIKIDRSEGLINAPLENNSTSPSPLGVEQVESTAKLSITPLEDNFFIRKMLEDCKCLLHLNELLL